MSPDYMRNKMDVQMYCSNHCESTEKRNDIMIDKKYLDRLKEDDYIAWAELENDPLVVGQNTGGGVILVIVALLIVIGTAFLLFF